LDLFQFLSGNEIETQITEIKTNIFSEKLGFYLFSSQTLSEHL